MPLIRFFFVEKNVVPLLFLVGKIAAGFVTCPEPKARTQNTASPEPNARTVMKFFKIRAAQQYVKTKDAQECGNESRKRKTKRMQKPVTAGAAQNYVSRRAAQN